MTELFPEEIVTERLRLVQESVADGTLRERYESMSAERMDESDVAYVPIEPFEHVQEAYEFVAQREERAQSGDAGTYVVRPREGEDGAGEPAGEAELFAVWQRQAAFMTFGLRKRFWGRGYSGERAAALIRLAFERLDLEVVFVSHLVENENSRRAIERYVERFGGHREGRLRNQYPMGGEPRDVVQYAISQEAYRESGERPDCEFVDARDDRRESQ